MSRSCLLLFRALTLGAVVAIVGCARTNDVHQFEPLPSAEVGTEELEPVETRSLKELLAEAEHAFQEANKAQEEGDYELALRKYTTMLEALVEADFDPAVFYNLRGEFERILEGSTQHADIMERRRSRIVRDWDDARDPLSDLQIPFPLPERVLQEIDEIQNAYPRSFQRGLNRSFRYMPHIQEQFARAGLPEDLAWLAMVESQFWPRAVSPAGAGGMWQFMRPTGRQYNLHIDSHVDQRFDWEKSTQAAIEYLTYLYNMFDGDWALAVSAYNMGEGGLMQAMEMNGGSTDLWELIETPPASNRIRLETKKFYPRVLATIIVANNPQRYGFEVDPYEPLEFERVPVRGSYSLAALERAAGYESGILETLNPDILSGSTPPGREHLLAVPADTRERFEVALNDVREEVQPAAPQEEIVLASASGGAAANPSSSGNSATHTVRRGETLSGIAQHHGVNAREIMQANNIQSANLVRVGQELTIPGAASAQPAAAAPAIQQAVGGAGLVSEGRTYRVRRGDTLYEIAHREGVSIADLQEWNNMGSRARISVNEVLVVSPPSEGTRAHTVQTGETPGGIAARYGVAVNDLLRWNNLSGNAVIRPGDELVITGGAPSGPGGRATVAEFTHEVQRGESASAIASEYGVSLDDFLAWNNLTRSSTLRVGDEYIIRIPRDEPNERQQTVLARLDGGAAANGGANGERIVHVVAQGQNPSVIAQRYGVALSDLFEWNGWQTGNAPVLHVGNEVIVYSTQ